MSEIIKCLNCGQKNRINKNADSSKAICARCRTKLAPQKNTIQQPSPEDFSTTRLRVGYVYVLFNESVPNYVKIGMTTRDVNERAKELSNTGVPGKWEVYFCTFVPDCEKVERLVHKYFEKLRYSSNREFFNIPLGDAEKIVVIKANENISEYPGWPDPQSVKNHFDKVELEKKKVIKENRLRVEYEERKREKERKETEHKEYIRRKVNADKSTKETLSSGPLGWGTMLIAGFGLIGEGNTDIRIILVILVILMGLGLRRNDKRKAVEVREKWGLPPA